MAAKLQQRTEINREGTSKKSMVYQEGKRSEVICFIKSVADNGFG